VVSLTPLPFYPRGKNGPCLMDGSLGALVSILPLEVIELRFLGRPARGLGTIQTVLSRLTIYILRDIFLLHQIKEANYSYNGHNICRSERYKLQVFRGNLLFLCSGGASEAMLTYQTIRCMEAVKSSSTGARARRGELENLLANLRLSCLRIYVRIALWLWVSTLKRRRRNRNNYDLWCKQFFLFFSFPPLPQPPQIQTAKSV
jgi:hypothetical protein